LLELAPTAAPVGYRYNRQLRWLGGLQNVETLGHEFTRAESV
jgi:hypothetical protein